MSREPLSSRGSEGRTRRLRSTRLCCKKYDFSVLFAIRSLFQHLFRKQTSLLFDEVRPAVRNMFVLFSIRSLTNHSFTIQQCKDPLPCGFRTSQPVGGLSCVFPLSAGRRSRTSTRVAVLPPLPSVTLFSLQHPVSPPPITFDVLHLVYGPPL